MNKKAFTLTEILVVIAIITILIGLIIPTVIKAYAAADKKRTQADLATISLALSAYTDDFGDIPRVNTPDTGATTLYLALVGPTGTGFKMRNQGKTYGPYINASSLPLDSTNRKIIDRNKYPILYFPGLTTKTPYSTNPDPNIITQDCYIRRSTTANKAAATFDATDNLADFGTNGASKICIMLGDTNADGTITPSPIYPWYDETPVAGKFLLWAAGPDGAYGPQGIIPAVTAVTPSDTQAKKDAAAQVTADTRTMAAQCDDIISTN